jgi:electron transfer flavoprotein beta subunit
VTKVEVTGGNASAERNVEGGVEVLGFPLPAVCTIDEGFYKPRFIALKGIMAAKKKPLESKPAQLDEPRLTIARLDNPPERPPGRIIGEGAAAVPELVRLLHTEAKVL